jgi:hypothetical protein
MCHSPCLRRDCGVHGRRRRRCSGLKDLGGGGGGAGGGAGGGVGGGGGEGSGGGGCPPRPPDLLRLPPHPANGCGEARSMRMSELRTSLQVWSYQRCVCLCLSGVCVRRWRESPCACARVRVCACAHVRMCACARVRLGVRACTCVRTYIHIYTNMPTQDHGCKHDSYMPTQDHGCKYVSYKMGSPSPTSFPSPTVHMPRPPATNVMRQRWPSKRETARGRR